MQGSRLISKNNCQSKLRSRFICSPFLLCFEFCLIKTHQKETILSRRFAEKYAQLTMTTLNFTASYQASLPTQQKLRGGGDNMVVGTVVKAKIGELEEEVREDFF